MDRALESGNKAQAVGYARRLAKQGDFDNDIRRENYIVDFNGNNDIPQYFKDKFGAAGFSEQEQFRVIEDLGKISEGNGQYAMSRGIRKNIETDEYEVLSGEEWSNTITSQAQKKEKQQQARSLHRDAYKSETGAWVEADFEEKLARGEDVRPVYQGLLSKMPEEIKRRVNLEDNDLDKIKLIDIDIGFHDGGRGNLSTQEVKHSSRFPNNAKMGIMNHPEEMKNINRGLYNQFWEDTVSMDLKEYEEAKARTFNRGTIDPATGMIDKIEAKADLKTAVNAPDLSELSKPFITKMEYDSGARNSAELEEYFDINYRDQKIAAGQQTGNQDRATINSTQAEKDAIEYDDKATQKTAVINQEKDATKKAKLTKERDGFVEKAKEIRAQAKINELESEVLDLNNYTADKDSTDSTKEALDGVIDSAGIKQISDALESAISTSKMTGVMDLAAFTAVFDAQSRALSAALTALPNNIKRSLPNSLSNFSNTVRIDQITSIRDKHRTLMALHNIANILNKKADGKYGGTNLEKPEKSQKEKNE